MNKIVLMQIDLSCNDYANNRVAFTTKAFDDVLLAITLVSCETPPQTVKVYGRRKDGENLTQTRDIEIKEDKVYVKLNNSFTCVPGLNELELRLLDEEGQVSTKTYKYQVNPNLSSEDSFEVVTVYELKEINDKANETLADLVEANEKAESNLPSLADNVDRAEDILPILSDNVTKATILTPELVKANASAIDYLPGLVTQNTRAEGNISGLHSENANAEVLIPELNNGNKNAIINIEGLKTQNDKATTYTPKLKTENDTAQGLLPNLESNNNLAKTHIPKLDQGNDTAQTLLPELVKEVNKGLQLLESLKVFVQNNNVDNLLNELQNLKTNQNILTPSTNPKLRIRLGVDEEGILTTEILNVEE